MIFVTCQVIQTGLLSPNWSSLNHLKGHLTIPKRSRIESPGGRITVFFSWDSEWLIPIFHQPFGGSCVSNNTESLSKNGVSQLPSVKLTARTWKWTVGRPSFHFGARPIFRAYVSCREGPGYYRTTHPKMPAGAGKVSGSKKNSLPGNFFGFFGGSDRLAPHKKIKKKRIDCHHCFSPF